MDPNELLGLIKARRTIREMNKEPICEEAVKNLLSSATWAPSAHNAQPWRFVVMQDQDSRYELLTKMGERWKQDLKADGMQQELIDSLTNSSMSRFLGCPLIVVVAMTMEDMDKYPDNRRNSAERIMAIESVSAAIQNMLLMAHALGIGASWSCAPLFAPEAVKQVLRLRDNWQPIAMIALGFPRRTPDAPPRKAINEVAIWI